MNQYFYLKIKKYNIKKTVIKSKVNSRVFSFNKVILKKKNLKIFKKEYDKNKFKYSCFIFFSKKKIKFKPSLLLLKLSLNERKYCLWLKIDYLFHTYFFYNSKKWLSDTVFINFIESIKCFNTLYYLHYAKKKLIEIDDKLILEEKKNIKFWIWILNLNTNFTYYFHNAKSFLNKFMRLKNYRYKFFKKNFIRYNISFISLKVLSFILEENFKEKVLNSSKSKWNSQIKRLFFILNSAWKFLEKRDYLYFHLLYFKIKRKLIFFSYVVVNDVRNTKIIHFWLFRYLLFDFTENFFKKFIIKLNVFFINIDNFMCLIKLLKFEKSNLKKKKLIIMKNPKTKLDSKTVQSYILNFFVGVFEDILSFFGAFLDKEIVNDFKKVYKKSRIYIYPELKILMEYIKNIFKK